MYLLNIFFSALWHFFHVQYKYFHKNKIRQFCRITTAPSRWQQIISFKEKLHGRWYIYIGEAMK